MLRQTLRALVLTAACLPLAQSGAFGEWTPIQTSLNAGRVRTMAVAPTNSDRVFVSTTTKGFYRTDDLGVSWTDLTTRLPLDQTIQAVAVAPDDANLVLAGGPGPYPSGPAVLFRSADAGERWTPITDGLGGQGLTGLLFNPDDASVVFASVAGASTGGVYRSLDGGSSWERVTSTFGDLFIRSLALDPLNPQLVVAGTDQGHLRSGDGGSSWQFYSTGITLSRLSWSPVTSGLVWASGYDDLFEESVYRSTDGGISFAPRGKPVQGYALGALAADPVDANRVLLTSWAGCGGWDGGAVWRTTTQGSSWTLLFAPGDCSELPTGVAIDPSDPSRVYFSTWGATGFWVSTNSGTAWTPRNSGLHSYEIDFVRSDGTGNVYARGPQASLLAADPSDPWSDQSPDYYAEVSGFDVNQGVPGLLYECGTGFESDIGVPYAISSADFGSNWWPPLGELPPGVDEYPDHVASAWDELTVYLLGSAAVFRSVDQNQTYTRVNSSYTFRVAAIDPVDSFRLYAGQSVAPVVMYSTDGGATWNPRAAGLPAAAPVYLGIDPADSDHLVVALNGFGAYESEDGGGSWSSLFAYSGDIDDAAWDPVLDHVYLATSEEGVVSNDPGLSNFGLGSAGVSSVAYDAVSRKLVAGTGNGAYVTPLLDPSDVGDAESPALSSLTLRVAPVPARESVTIDLQRSAGTFDGATVRVVVLDVRGRVVNTIFEGVPSTDLRVDWDTHDAAGRPVPAGLYWVRATTPEVSFSGATERVLILR